MLALLLAVTFGCSPASDGSKNKEPWINNVGALDETYSTVTSALPYEASTFETNVNLVNSEVAIEEKIQEALIIIKSVVASSEFRERVLNHRYNDERTFVDNRGFSNAQIYKIILDAAESLRPSINNVMDLEVEIYFENSSTVGYTYPNSDRIWVNKKFYDNYSPVSIAQNLFHEWLHKLGFDHSTTYSVSRNYSVPYAIGHIMSDLGKNFL